MRKCVSTLLAVFAVIFISNRALSQTITITGNVENSISKEKIPAVSVVLKGATTGTFTDDKGNFKISTNKPLPLTLIFSSIGFEIKEVTADKGGEELQVSMTPANSLGQDVIVAASRYQQKFLESPVSVERVSAANIRVAPTANFYEVLTHLKGVDVTTSSLTFSTPTTRGFNSSGNTRFNQLVDGMDNQAPGLNFSVASIIGLSDLDVDNMELLAGASSALYGPGGMNGTLLMTSKNPFKYQGLSFLVSEGVMNTDSRQRGDVTPYHNWSLRWAKKLSEKFAFKVNAQLVQAVDWLGQDYRDYNRIGYNGDVKAGNRVTDPNYDGINVYGDETSVDIMKNALIPIAQKAPFLSGFIYGLDTNKVINVSRTGYTEKEVINPNTVNFKLGGSFHYKITPSTEATLAGYWGTGNTIYTGNARYSFKDFKMGQYKFELNNKKWMFRAYSTQENAGESYNATVTTQLFNESWKASPGDNGWYAQYAQAYLGGLLAGLSSAEAHTKARALADVGRPAAGSSVFQNSFEEIRKRPIPQGGLLLDKSDLYSVEGSYNLSSITSSFADIIIGANYRKYVLNSEGTLFADTSGVIDIGEYGAFIQATREVFDRLKLTVSGRYDKNENFDGRFTPRATAVIKVNENNNIRLSYQTAYRFPSTQQQWINLYVGSYWLIGSNPAFNNIHKFSTNPVYSLESVQAGNPQRYNIATQKPETVSSFEAGYKGLIMNKRMLIDLYGYYGQYQDFIGRTFIVQSNTGNPVDLADPTKRTLYSIPINTSDKVKTYGFGIGIDYNLPYNFVISANAASDVLKDVPANFVAYFNAPKYKVNASIGNSGFGGKKRFGFNFVYRWQDGLFYQGDFANGSLPAIHTLDGQVSYKFPKSKSIFKIGSTNLLNEYYYNAIGNSQVGGLYYVSFGYNIY